jgi:hypothetical protein
MEEEVCAIAFRCSAAWQAATPSCPSTAELRQGLSTKARISQQSDSQFLDRYLYKIGASADFVTHLAVPSTYDKSNSGYRRFFVAALPIGSCSLVSFVVAAS